MIKRGVRTPDTVREALNRLHVDAKTSWRKIARMSDYSGIPAGTLSSIAKGYPIPRKWRRRLNVPDYAPAPVCLRCGEVHVTRRCTKRSRDYRSLWDMPPEELRRRIEERKEL